MCKKYQVYCIIDWHEISKWQDKDKQFQLERFWSSVARRYAHEPNILYEVFNEPTGPGTMSRENWLLWREVAQPWVNQIRAAAPETVILVGSPHWSQMPQFAVQDPFAGKNLAYVMHLYPGWSSDTWDRFIGNPSKSVPIFITEWGWSAREDAKKSPFYGTKEKYGAPLRAYLDARPNIHWTAWAYHEGCGPAMLGKDTEMGEFVKEWLGS
jgi:endoglucanase